MEGRHFSGLGEIELAYLDIKEKYDRLSDGIKGTYESRIMRLLNDLYIPLYLREHYAESPNYYTNSTHEGMVETLNWLSYPDKDKKMYLDEELAEYFEDKNKS